MPRVRRGLLLLSLAPLLWTPAAGRAESTEEVGIQLAEGLWLFDVAVRSPLKSTPSTRKLKTCATEAPLTADRLMPLLSSRGCKIRNVKAIENGIRWQIRCRMDGQTTKGRGEFVVDGDRGKGKAKVKFTKGGHAMPILTKWDARRVGPCPDPTAIEIMSDDEGAARGE